MTSFTSWDCAPFRFPHTRWIAIPIIVFSFFGIFDPPSLRGSVSPTCEHLPFVLSSIHKRLSLSVAALRAALIESMLPTARPYVCLLALLVYGNFVKLWCRGVLPIGYRVVGGWERADSPLLMGGCCEVVPVWSRGGRFAFAVIGRAQVVLYHVPRFAVSDSQPGPEGPHGRAFRSLESQRRSGMCAGGAHKYAAPL